MKKDIKSTYYDFDLPNGKGEKPTTARLQMVQSHGITKYALCEHPENKGLHVSNHATKVGDQLIQKEIKDNPSYKPNQLHMHVEKPGRPDGHAVFAKVEAKTTLQKDVTLKDGKTVSQATQWQWKDDGNRISQKELERGLGARVPTSAKENLKSTFAVRQEQALKDTPLAKPAERASYQEQAKREYGRNR